MKVSNRVCLCECSVFEDTAVTRCLASTCTKCCSTIFGQIRCGRGWRYYVPIRARKVSPKVSMVVVQEVAIHCGSALLRFQTITKVDVKWVGKCQSKISEQESTQKLHPQPNETSRKVPKQGHATETDSNIPITFAQWWWWLWWPPPRRQSHQKLRVQWFHPCSVEPQLFWKV